MAQPQDRPHTSSFWSGIFFRTIYASWKQSQNWISILFCQLFVALSVREGSNTQSFQFLTAKPKFRPWPSAPLCFQRFSEVTSSLSNFRLLADFDRWTKVETMTLSSPCFQPQNTAVIYSRPTIWRQRKQPDLFFYEVEKVTSACVPQHPFHLYILLKEWQLTVTGLTRLNFIRTPLYHYLLSFMFFQFFNWQLLTLNLI